MTWWLIHSSRLSSEKAAISDLAASVDWLRVGNWQANSELILSVDFQITNGDEEFAFRMIYPSVFPDAPPMIYTEDKTRISRHQYGADGELCLEYRPDNWQQSITGGNMIASCQRLLAEERLEHGTILHARSAHVPSLGRDMRSKTLRFLLTKGDIAALSALAKCTPVPIGLRDRKVGSIYVAALTYLGSEIQPVWVSDLLLPQGGTKDTGFAVFIAGIGNLGEKTAKELGELLEFFKLTELSHSVLNNDKVVHLIIGEGENWTLYCIFGKTDDRKVLRYSTLKLPNASQRIPTNFESLTDKNVGIVGCGSVGSKIAASLCRSGVGKFFLIDEDIFFPGNVIRNELDLSAIGTHKAHALRDRLLRINPQVDIKTLRIALGGQESAGSMAGALETLGECDLLVDATAEPTAFNMIASISKRQSKPMIWVEVFAGGIGGIVARARPGIDPVPLAAREQIETWCNDQDVDWIRPANPTRYDGQANDGTPLIASDAEISIMAAHATRFATDILAQPEVSIFPRSAYVVGFSSEWLFNEPFHTFPIDLIPDGAWGETLDNLEPKALIQLLREHLPSKEGDDEVNPAK